MLKDLGELVGLFFSSLFIRVYDSKKLNQLKSLAFILFLGFLNFSSTGYSYVYDYTKPIVYQFPETPGDHDKLLYTYEIINFLDLTYRQTIASTHLKTQLFWDFRWEQNYLGAGSSFYQNRFNIMLFGGHVRAEGSDFDLIAFTLCHEVSHYLGGAPHQRIHNPSGDWSSAEGQTDWFAAKECLPKLYNYFTKTNPQRLKTTITPLALKQCQTSPDKDKCAWILNIAQKFADFAHYYYQRDQAPAQLSLTAQEITPVTLFNQYPTTQCRLDTIRLAGLCSTKTIESSKCTRPRCWFNGEF